MENASKALIIAGAILIAILLISVGIIVINTINEPLSETDKVSHSQSVEIFNSNFSGYGGSQKGSAVKSLLNKIGSYGEEAPTLKGDLGDNAGTAAGGVDITKTYTITFEYDEAGYIETISIEE